MCPQGLLFVWPVQRHKVHYELQTRGGRRFTGAARSGQEAVKFGMATMLEHGLDRMRVVDGRAVEVPSA